jgi:hypothetical protein
MTAPRSFIDRPDHTPESNERRAAEMASENWSSEAPLTSSTIDSSLGFSTVNRVPSPLTKAPSI